MIVEMCGLNGFADIVSADDVRHGKPAPDIFLLAARRLGAPPARCIVFEDAPAGIDAGRTAGMRVIAVTTTHPAERLGRAQRIVRRLDELTVDDLSLWMNGG
jgi:sugar-phosphatase